MPFIGIELGTDDVGVASLATPTSGFDVEFILFDGQAGERWPVYPIDANVGHDKTMLGAATLSFPYDDDAATLFMGSTIGQEFPNVSLRVMLRGTMIWAGPVVSSTMSTRGTGGVVDIVCEHVWSWAHKRRVLFYTGLDVTDITAEADNAVLTAQRQNMGPTPILPTGHPGTRTDFGPFTIAAEANHSPALAPSTRLLEQSGNNLLDLVTTWLEAHDLAPLMTEVSENTFKVDNDYPFQDEDLSDLVIFGQYHGNLTSFELVSDRTALANIWAIEGKTAKSVEFDDDSASITLWGEAEAFAQKPQDTNVDTAKASIAGEMVALYGGPRVTYKAEVIETDGHQFVTDFFWRDKIRIDEAVFGFQIAATVNAWNIQVANSRVHRLDIVLGQPRYADLLRDVIGYTGLPGPRRAGSPWRNRRQA